MCMLSRSSFINGEHVNTFIIVVGLVCVGIVIYASILSILVRMDGKRPRPRQVQPKAGTGAAPWDVGNLPRGKRES
jgi:hypothetical protein